MRFSFSVGTSGCRFGVSNARGSQNIFTPPPATIYQPAGAAPSNGLSFSLNDLASLTSSNPSLDNARKFLNESQQAAIVTDALKKISTPQSTNLEDKVISPLIAISPALVTEETSTQSSSIPTLAVPTKVSNLSSFYTDLAADVATLASSNPLPTHPDCVVPKDVVDTVHTAAQMTSVIFSVAGGNVELIDAIAKPLQTHYKVDRLIAECQEKCTKQKAMQSIIDRSIEATDFIQDIKETTNTKKRARSPSP